MTAAACLPAGLLALLLAWLLEGPLPVARIPTGDWGLIIGLALGPMGAAFVTWYLALRDGDPRRIGALAYLTPLLSTLLLVLLNGEQLTPVTWWLVLSSWVAPCSACWASPCPPAAGSPGTAAVSQPPRQSVRAAGLTVIKAPSLLLKLTPTPIAVVQQAGMLP